MFGDDLIGVGLCIDGFALFLFDLVGNINFSLAGFLFAEKGAFPVLPHNLNDAKDDDENDRENNQVNDGT